MITRIASVVCLIVFAAGFVACNTTKGVGEDMERGGRAIERSAERHGANP